MHRLSTMMTMAIMTMVLAACSNDDPGGNAGWDIGPGSDAGADVVTTTDGATDTDRVDARQDADRDVSPDTERADVGPDSYQVTFELQNDSGRPIYASTGVDQTTFCNFGDPRYWVSVRRDGQPQRLRDRCDRCNCSEPQCAVCAVDCAPGPTQQGTKLSDGQSRTYEWDARVWNTTSQNCELPEFVAGETLEAEFCYGAGFDTDTRQITDVQCETVEFDVDQAQQTVRVTAEPPEPHDIHVRMINETGHMLYAPKTGSCTGGRRWYSLGDGASTYQVSAGCSTCRCSELEQHPDQSCGQPCPGIPCPAPTEAMFEWAAGQERNFVWDGRIYVDDEVDSQSCKRRVVPPITQTVATFCWSETIEHPTEYDVSLGELTCQDVSFDRIADDEVEFRVQ